MTTTKVRIGDVLELNRTPISLDEKAEYRAIGIRSFGKGVFEYPPVAPEELSKLRYFTFPSGALALSNIKAWEGAIAVTHGHTEGAVASNRFLFYTEKSSEVHVPYFRYYFLSERGLHQIRQASPGSADRNRTLGIKNFESIEVPLPDLDEQRRIAAKLDSFSRKIDIISDSRSRMGQTYTDLAESLVNELVSGSERCTPIGELFELNRSEIDIDPDKGYRAVGVRSFGNGLIRYSPVPGNELSKLSYFSFPENALVLSNIKAWEGAIALTSEHENNYVASNRFLFYTPVSEDVDLSYIRHYLLSRRGLEQVGKASPGAADRNRTLGRKSFERMQVPLPDIGEQRKASKILDSVAQRLGRRGDGTHLKALRSSLLNAAFSGRL